MRYLAITLMIVCGSVSIQAQGREQFWGVEKEKALGAQLASQVRNRPTSLGLVDVDKYVQRLGQRLAKQMPDTRENWLFSVIRDHRSGSTCEPIALPGGYVFVSARLILAAENEAEFAGMLAHSMAHVVERHGVRQANRGEISQLAAIPVFFVGGAAFGDDENNLVPVAFLKTRRQLELEADQFAVNAIAHAGYDPHALLNYIQRVQPQLLADESLSPLPPLSLRIGNLEKAIQSLSEFGPRASAESFRSIQEEVRNELARSAHNEVPSLIHPKR